MEPMSNLSAEYTLESGVQMLDAPLGQSWWTSHSNPEDVKDLWSNRPLVAGPMYVSILACSGWRFELRKPVAVRETYEQGTWTQRYEPLGILAYGQSREEATKAFCADFAGGWEML